jgi:hypothetical protein
MENNKLYYMSQVFIKNGHFCNVSRDNAEVYERYMLRGFAIISNIPKTLDEYKQSVIHSRYLSNIKYLGCSFSKQIHDACEQLEKKIFI